MNRRQRDKLKAKEAAILDHAEKCSECLQGYICSTGERAMDSFERTRAKYMQDARERAAKAKQKRAKEAF